MAVKRRWQMRKFIRRWSWPGNGLGLKRGESTPTEKERVEGRVQLQTCWLGETCETPKRRWWPELREDGPGDERLQVPCRWWVNMPIEVNEITDGAISGDEPPGATAFSSPTKDDELVQEAEKWEGTPAVLVTDGKVAASQHECY